MRVSRLVEQRLSRGKPGLRLKLFNLAFSVLAANERGKPFKNFIKVESYVISVHASPSYSVMDL